MFIELANNNGTAYLRIVEDTHSQKMEQRSISGALFAI